MVDADPIQRLNAAFEGRYRIERELGAGGTATVYLAEDLRHHRNVALKVLQPDLAAVVGSQRFLAEIQTTANLQHPHILPLFDSGDADGFLFYVMPYVEGESMRQRLDREHQLPVDDAIDIASDVAAALDYAHGRGIIHRDVKPANILLQSGRPLVADFGIALALSHAGGSRLTETGLSLGTPQYMSPEQAAGDRLVDARSDVYSLGVVLYEMLTGDPPLTASSVQAMIGRIVSERPAPISRTRETVPPNVDAAVLTALAKWPADRFASAAQFARALRDRSFSLPDAGANLSPSQVSRRSRSILAPLMVVLVATVAALWAWFGRSTEQAGEVTRLTLDIPPSGALVVGEGSVSGGASSGWFALSPDGRQVAYVDSAGGIMLRDLANLEARALTDRAGIPFSFSPDGAWIGAFTELGIIKVPSGGGTPTEVGRTYDVTSALYGAAWGPDDFIYFSHSNSGILRMPAAGGGIEVVTTLDAAHGEQNHRSPELLPDGRGLLFTSQWSDSSRIMLHSFETGRTMRIAEGSTPKYVLDGYLMFGNMRGELQAIRFDLEQMLTVGSPTSMTGNVHVTWSGRIAYDVSDGGTLLYQPAWEPRRSVVFVDRQGSTRLLPVESGPIEQARISHDGTRVALVQRRPGGTDIFVEELEGERRQITSDQSQDWRPVWSPDGQYLAFMSDRDGGWSLYRKRADGTGPVEPVLLRARDDYVEDWSPDGRSILLFDQSGWGIWTVDARGAAQPRRVIPDCGEGDNGRTLGPPCAWAAFSPDGRYLAYTQRARVHVAALANPIATGLQVSLESSCCTPAWSPDGREIFYVSGVEGQPLMSVVFEPGGTLRVARRTRLFDTAGRFFAAVWLDVDPLGRGFVMIEDLPSVHPSPVLVLNFREELQARVGT